jgi:aryl-alcohol dehydrogenase-like predicted oxidoreductase
MTATVAAVPLGSAGLVVSALGQGCMGLTSFYGNDTASARPAELIAAALERGVSLFDTSDAYGPFINEEVVGDALAGRRSQVVLATKFGVVRTAGQSDGMQAVGLCGNANYVREACEASLRRLRTDYIDLYFMHRVDPQTPIEETMLALADLVRAGKVRFVGLCEVNVEQIHRAHAVHPLTAVQSEYSLWHRDPEDEVRPLLDQLGVGLIGYSPLGRGFLTGMIRCPDDLAPDDWRRNNPRFSAENFARNLALVDHLRALAQHKGVTAAQLALAWLLRRGAVPLQGATSIAQLDENLASARVRLSDAELAAIDTIAPRGAAAGDAWPAGSIGAASRA